MSLNLSPIFIRTCFLLSPILYSPVSWNILVFLVVSYCICSYSMPLFLHLYYKAHSMSVRLCTSALAIFLDRFWNQGYLWTPHDPAMTTKIWNFKISKKKIFFEKFLSLNASSYPNVKRGQPEAALKRVNKRHHWFWWCFYFLHCRIACIPLSFSSNNSRL